MNIKHLALAVLILPLHGQEKPNRFKKTSTLPKGPDDLPVTVMNLIEYFEVGKDDLHNWRTNNPQKKVTRELVSDWVGKGLAFPTESFFYSTRLEKNCSIKSGQHFQYPVSHNLPKFSGEWLIPAYNDTIILGHRIDTSFKQDDQGHLRANIHFSETQFLGSDALSSLAEKTRSPDDLFMPRFKIFRQISELPFPGEDDSLVGILNALDDETKSLLILASGKKTTLAPVPKIKPASDSQKLISVSTEVVDVPAQTWRHYCSKSLDQVRVEAATWIETLVKDQKATRLEAVTKEIPWKEKSHLLEGETFHYPITYKRTDPSKRTSKSNPLIPDKQEGYRDHSLSVTPQTTATGHISLAYKWQIQKLRKQNVIHRYQDGEKWIPDAWAPNLTFIDQSGSIFLNPGEKTLIGALPLENDPAQSAPPMMRLFFLKAH